MAQPGEGPPDFGVEGDPSANYEAALARIQATIRANEGFVADLGNGERVLAGTIEEVHAKYGAHDDDTRLTIVITETQDAEAGVTTYGLTMYHYGPKSQLRKGYDWIEFRTPFGPADLKDYNEDGTEEWCCAIEDAEYDSDESWYWVPNDHPSEMVQTAKAQQTRVRRLLSAWRAAQSAAQQDPGSAEAA